MEYNIAHIAFLYTKVNLEESHEALL